MRVKSLQRRHEDKLMRNAATANDMKLCCMTIA